MKKVLTIAAVLEAATGVALLIVPSLVGRLLFGEEFTGIVIPVARVLGIALIALGVGCLPGELFGARKMRCADEAGPRWNVICAGSLIRNGSDQAEVD